jgi:prenyltransferase beta subunit
LRRFLAFLILALLFVAMLSPAITTGVDTRRQHIVSFAAACIDDRGGAVLHSGVTVPTVSATYAIAGVLETLSAWTAADDLLPKSDLAANMTKWIKGLQNTTKPTNNSNYGGFLALGNTTITTLRYTHDALLALSWLNTTTSINGTLAANFTVNLQRVNATQYPTTLGGFADRYNENASVAATYYALEALVVLGQLSRINSSLAITWLNSCQVLAPANSTSYGGFTNGRNATVATLQSTYMAVRSLEILGALASMNQSAAITFALSCYHSDSNYPQYQGGFGQTPDDFVSTQSATCYAVATLGILGAESQLAAEAVPTWVLGKQCADGGFADVTPALGLAPETYFAVATLALLNRLDRLNEVTEPEPYIFPIWIVGLAVLIVLLVICVVVARRQKWF